MAYVLRLPVGLKELSPTLGTMERMTTFNELAAKAGLRRKADKLFSNILARLPEEAKQYACEDAVATARDYRILKERLDKEPKLDHYYRAYEKPLVPILHDMEQVGMLIDADALDAAGGGLLEDAARIREELGFNPNSHPQMVKFLSGLDIRLKENRNGNDEVDKAALEEIARTNPAMVEPIDMVIRYRENIKTKSTYVDAVLEGRDAEGRIHPRFNQTVTATNRLSSSNPNAQNIPARKGPAIRRCFIAKPGHVLVKADGSQLEVRGFASVTQDPTLCRAIRGGLDVHGAVCEELGLPKSKRVIAKTIVFAFVYGATVDKLDEILRVNAGIYMNPVELADLAKRLQEKLPAVANWQKQTGYWLDRQGYVESVFGWRNYYPGWFSGIANEQAKALREAANMPIQSLAAGWAKRLMIAGRPLWEQYDSKCINQVHDEVLLEVPCRAVQELCPKLEALGAEVGSPEIEVPIVLDVKVGRSWADGVDYREWVDELAA